MAISPLSSPGAFRLLDISSRLDTDPSRVNSSENKASVTDISSTDNSIVKARNSSLLYQVVDTLLESDQTPTQSSASNQVYNRLLTASLVDNEEFIRTLKEE